MNILSKVVRKLFIGIILITCLMFIFFGVRDFIVSRRYVSTTGELNKRQNHVGEQYADPDEPYKGFYVYYVEEDRYVAYSNSGRKSTTIMYDPEDPGKYIIPHEDIIFTSIGIVGLASVILIEKRRRHVAGRIITAKE
ncbi:hypothetical protein SAMN06296952_0045 [Oscillospiraceae bacterium]|nr:hypothetical protein SAMN06296952_0045 [Oscillospiraceae bacterium]